MKTNSMTKIQHLEDRPHSLLRVYRDTICIALFIDLGGLDYILQRKKRDPRVPGDKHVDKKPPLYSIPCRQTLSSQCCAVLSRSHCFHCELPILGRARNVIFNLDTVLEAEPHSSYALSRLTSSLAPS